MRPINVTVWADPGSTGAQVILVHGTMTWGSASFAQQRPLARHARMFLVDRRGFGGSPDVEQSDYDIDAEDVVALMDRPSHLVGHSYGGVVAMLAAIRRPEQVSSLALIEPAALAVAAGHPVVAAALESNRRWVAASRAMSAEDYLRASLGVGSEPAPPPTESALRAAHTAMRERPCWEAEVPVDAIRPTSYPKLVLAGTWTTASAEYRATTGDALVITAKVVAERIGASFHQVDDADHSPHQQRPDEVNRLLLELWELPHDAERTS